MNYLTLLAILEIIRTQQIENTEPCMAKAVEIPKKGGELRHRWSAIEELRHHDQEHYNLELANVTFK